jgi:hypothetical protein
MMGYPIALHVTETKAARPVDSAQNYRINAQSPLLTYTRPNDLQIATDTFIFHLQKIRSHGLT